MKAGRREYVAVRDAANAAAVRDAKTKAAPEMMREHMWHVLPLIEKQRAVRLAGLAGERARDPLATFSDEERMAVKHAVEMHLLHMSVLVQCVASSRADQFGLPH